MNEIGIVFRAEFLRKARSRPFLLGTLIGALAILGLAALPNFVTRALDNATRQLVLAGDPDLVPAARSLLARDYTVVAIVPIPAQTPTLADLNAHGKASALAIVRRHGTQLTVSAYTRDPGNFEDALERDLAPLGLSLATNVALGRVESGLKVNVALHSLNKKFADSASADAARGVAYLLVMLLYLAILLNSQIVMASVAEEKTSRIAEVLVATMDPVRLLAGKLLAAGVLGIGQLALWILVGVASGAGVVGAFVSHHGHAAHVTDTSVPLAISGTVLAAFVLFFVFGFLQYATMYAAAASLINRPEDISSVAAPLVVPVLGGLFIAQYALAFPQSPHIAVLSQIPLISPFVMFTRLTVSSVPAWQIGLSLAINLVATIVIVVAAGRVYRVGLLLYGRPPSLSQVIAALR